MRAARGLLAVLAAAAMLGADCSSGPGPEACGDQDAPTIATALVDIDGDGEQDRIRLTEGVIATCTGTTNDVFEHAMATEHLVPWSFGPDHPMGLLFGESTVALLELHVATWTEDGWALVTDGLGNPVVMRAGSDGTTRERHHLYDHQCGSEPNQIVSTEVDLLGAVPVVSETTWSIEGTTATSDVQTHEDPTLNPDTWFSRRTQVPCPWMQGGV